MTPRRPYWIWGAAVIVCLAGTVAGPSMSAVVTAVWTAFQPKTLVFGWDVIALVALFGLIWLAAVYAVARGLRGKAAAVFAIAAVAVAGAAVLYERLQPPSEVTHSVLTGEEAAAWRNFRP